MRHPVGGIAARHWNGQSRVDSTSLGVMSVIQDVFSYAVRGNGKYILIIGSVIHVMSYLMGFAPLIGIIANWILFAYFCAVYFQIIETTATGSTEAPEFPEISNPVGDLLVPMCKVCGVALAVFSPLIAYLFAVDNPSAGVVFALAGAAAVYFPMAMMAVVVLGYLGAMGPQIVVPAIFRAGGLYWLSVFLLLMLYLGQIYVVDAVEGIPFLGQIVSAVVSMYLLMTNGRMLGIIYRERREEMGWI